jgi:hypothetical protein
MSNVYTMTWALKDIPPYSEEPFVNSIDSDISGIRFQLLGFPNWYTHREESVLKNWETLDKDLYRSSAFGGVMTSAKRWERRELMTIVPDSANDLDKATAVFTFVRDHFLTQSREFMEGLPAEAIILSTKDNGQLNPSYPLVENFNYVITRVDIDGKVYLPDATAPRIGFGKLPLDCYNGYARVIRTPTTKG